MADDSLEQAWNWIVEKLDTLAPDPFANVQYDDNNEYSEIFLNNSSNDNLKLQKGNDLLKHSPNNRQGSFQNFLIYNSLSFKETSDDSTGGSFLSSKDNDKKNIVNTMLTQYLQGDSKEANRSYFVELSFLKALYGDADIEGDENQKKIFDFLVQKHTDTIIKKLDRGGTLNKNDKDFIWNVNKKDWQLLIFNKNANNDENYWSYRNSSANASTLVPEALVDKIIEKMLEKNISVDTLFEGVSAELNAQVEAAIDVDYTKEKNAAWSAERIQYMINNIDKGTAYPSNNAEEPSTKDIAIKIPLENLKGLNAVVDAPNATPVSYPKGFSVSAGGLDSLLGDIKVTQGRLEYTAVEPNVKPIIRDENYVIFYKSGGGGRQSAQKIPVNKVSGSALNDPYDTSNNTGCILYDVYFYEPDNSDENSGWVGTLPDYYKDLPEFIKDLKEDKTFEGTDPSKYDFAFIEGEPYYDWSKSPISSIAESVGDAFFGGGGSTENQTNKLTKLYDQKYVEFVRTAVTGNEISVQWMSIARKETYDEDFHRLIFAYIIADKEIARRVKRFELTIEEAQKISEDQVLDDEAEKRILGAEAEGFLDQNNTPAPEAKGKYGTKEDIEGRQKFFKQCALILNLKDFSKAFDQHLGNGSPRQPANGSAFHGRFHMVRHKDNQELILNNLVSPVDGRIFFELPPHVVSALTPKIKLFRVENEKDDDGRLQETEFIFPVSTDLDRTRDYSRPQPPNLSIPDSFLSANFDKGEGCGMKEFSFEFNGTNPAESRNDIKATLKLYFQTFADFIRERISSNGKKYRFVDLVIQPQPETENGKPKQVNGIDILHPNQYEPSFYRIRAELGYHYNDAIENLYSDSSTLKSAIERTNKSFYLCMVDHELNIDIDGTVEVTISYRAYAETALKSLRYDALTTPELLAKKKENEAKLKAMLGNTDCGDEEIREMKRRIASSEEQLRKQSLQSIIKRLLDDKKIYIGKINEDDARQFRATGEFDVNCRLEKLGAPPANGTPQENLETGTEVNNDAVEYILTNELPADDPKKENGFNYNDIGDYTVQWFYFGDLLYTILDSMFDKNSGNQIESMEKTKFLLGSFDFSSPLLKKTDPAIGINIAAIPISVEYFMKWFTDNVITQGETRKAFPILTFVRNLCNNLLGPSLLENCVNKDIDKTLRFSTGQISTYTKNGEDPIQKYVTNDRILNLPNSEFPLAGDETSAEGNNINNFYTYLTLMSLGSTLTYTGTGDYDEDVRVGRYHVDIGSNRGIVKNVKFSKTDMMYIREARFLQQGFDGLMQLSNVYKATIEMFGNTLFYPGNELFINPYGIGGTTLGSPTQGPKSDGGRSISNILGLGGYHTIISIKSSIKAGSYTTTIEAQQYYSGDGDNPNLNGKKLYDSLLDEKIEERKGNPENCKPVATEEVPKPDSKKKKNNKKKDPKKQENKNVVEKTKVEESPSNGGSSGNSEKKKKRSSSGGGGIQYVEISDTPDKQGRTYISAFEDDNGQVYRWKYDEMEYVTEMKEESESFIEDAEHSYYIDEKTYTYFYKGEEVATVKLEQKILEIEDPNAPPSSDTPKYIRSRWVLKFDGLLVRSAFDGVGELSKSEYSEYLQSDDTNNFLDLN